MEAKEPVSATGWIDERGNPVVPTPEQLNLQIDAITRRILKEWESKRAECMAGLDRIAQHPVEGLNLNADGTPWRRPRPDGIPPELADEFRTTFLGGGVTQLASVAKLKAQFALKQYAIAGVVAAASAMLGDNLYQFARALYARFIGH